jgi:hypothetical protein
MRLVGVALFPVDGGDPPPAADITIENGLDRRHRRPRPPPPPPHALAMPALANAHDHARPLSPTSFGGAGKPLETWLLRLGAMPAIDPYLGASPPSAARRAPARLGDGPLHAPARPDVR